MKLKLTYILPLAIVALVQVLLTSCANTSGPVEDATMGGYYQLPQDPVVRTIRFPSYVPALAEARVDNPEDPEQLILFAQALSVSGRHADAGGVFEEAATRFAAPDNELPVRCWTAAANEFLRAGDIAGFHRAVAGLREQANSYQLAGMSAEMASLMTLADYSQGLQLNPNQTPAYLSLLLEE